MLRRHAGAFHRCLGQNKDESNNFDQRHDLELARKSVYPIVEAGWTTHGRRNWRRGWEEGGKKWMRGGFHWVSPDEIQLWDPPVSDTTCSSVAHKLVRGDCDAKKWRVSGGSVRVSHIHVHSARSLVFILTSNSTGPDHGVQTCADRVSDSDEPVDQAELRALVDDQMREELWGPG